MIRKAIIVALTLAAVGTGLSWLGSHILYPWQAWTFPLSGGGRLNVWGVPGSGSFGVWRPAQDPVGDWSSHFGWGLDPQKESGWNTASLEWGEHTSGRFWVVRCAHWIPFIILAAYPGIAFIRGPFRRWRRRQKSGLCLTCGYNLTGNLSGVCPECGAEVESA